MAALQHSPVLKGKLQAVHTPSNLCADGSRVNMLWRGWVLSFNIPYNSSEAALLTTNTECSVNGYRSCYNPPANWAWDVPRQFVKFPFRIQSAQYHIVVLSNTHETWEEINWNSFFFSTPPWGSDATPHTYCGAPTYYILIGYEL